MDSASKVVMTFDKPHRAGRRYPDKTPSVRVSIRSGGKGYGDKAQLNVRINSGAMEKMRWLIGDRASLQFRTSSDGTLGVVISRTNDGYAISGAKDDKGKMKTGNIKICIDDAQVLSLRPIMDKNLLAICGTSSIEAYKEAQQ